MFSAVGNFVGIFLGSFAIGTGVAAFSALLFRQGHFKANEGEADPGPARALTDALCTPTPARLPVRQIAPPPLVMQGDSPPRLVFAGDSHGHVLEVSLLAILAYIAYMLADGLQLSGIVAVLFCGIVMARYTVKNLSDGAKDTAFSFFG